MLFSLVCNFSHQEKSCNANIKQRFINTKLISIVKYAYDWVQTINSEKYKRTQYPSRQFAKKNRIPTNNNKDLKKND